MSEKEKVRKMLAIERKQEWAKGSEKDFESTMFAELKRGDEYIPLPKPGDFKVVYNIFKKIKPIEKEDTKIIINSICLTDGSPASVPPEFAVIKLN